MTTVAELKNTASAMMQKSIDLALQGALEEALHAAQQVLFLWDRILETDFNNAEYQQSWRAAIARIDELEEQIEQRPRC